MPRDEARDAALDPRTMTPDWYARETRLAHMLPYVTLSLRRRYRAAPRHHRLGPDHPA
jgi:hypothetical protein